MPPGWTAERLTCGGALLHAAATWPDRDAVIMDGRRATYAGLLEETTVCARGLLGMGVEPGDHVGVLMPNCWDYLVLFHAITLIGANATLMNARYGTDELRFAIAKADLRFLFIGGHAAPRVDFRPALATIYPELADWDGVAALRLEAAPLLERVIELGDIRPTTWPNERALAGWAEAVPEARVRAAAAAVAPEAVCLMMFSSGTTSSPKACMLAHRTLVRMGQAVAGRWQMTAADRIYDPTPLFHMSTILPLAACWAVGAAFIGTRHFEAGEALDTMEREGATIGYTSFPAIMSALVDHPSFAGRDLSRLRLLNNVASPDLLRRYAEAVPQAVQVTAYGLTEACGVQFYSELSDTPEQRLTRAGRPLPGIEVRVVDPETGRDQPPEVQGEIWLRGFCLFEGYYNAPERTEEAMTADGWLRTGDLGDLDAEGRIRYLGRLKDMLKIGGENVAALEIESFLITHPAVRMVSVVGVPDDRLMEVPAAFVELRPGAQASAEELVRFCIGRIASFKIPRYVRFVEEWPMSATKIQKFRLLADFEPVGKLDPRELAAAG